MVLIGRVVIQTVVLVLTGSVSRQAIVLVLYESDPKKGMC